MAAEDLKKQVEDLENLVIAENQRKQQLEAQVAELTKLLEQSK